MSIESQHFTNQELACRHCGVNGCKQELIDALEALRVAVGKPVQVDDAYRCPEHNAAVGGVPNSEHTCGIAADIKIAGMTAAEMYRAALAVPAFALGGIGVAERQGYIHVDTRAQHARWCYDVAGKSCPWNPALDTAVAAAG
jgi:uncharacterized protein YcbK (DUF882 family)